MKNKIRRTLEKFTSFWWGEKGPSVLLVLLVVAFLVSPLLKSGPGKLLSSLFFSLLLLSGVTTMWDKRLPRIGAAVVAVTAFIFIWLKHFNPENTTVLFGAELCTFCYLVLLTGVVMRHVFKDGAVTASRVQGAVAGYILIGLTWATIYRILELYYPGSLIVSSPAAGLATAVGEWDFTYFSFVTLTTLGYGDIIPIHPATRIFVIFEALIGQLFPATLLARLVSLQTVQTKMRDEG